MKYFLLCACICAVVNSCVESPSDIGFTNFGSGDTLTLRTLDTRTDTVSVTWRHGVARTATVSENVFLVGRADSTIAEAFLKFSFPDTLGDAQVISATFVMSPAQYKTGDLTVRSLKLYVYAAQRVWGNNFTWDSLMTPSPVLSSTIRDSVTITNVDSGFTGIPAFDTALVRSWFVAAHDTLAPKNYGIGLVPAMDAKIIKAFNAQPSEGQPRLAVSYQKPGQAARTDTFQLERDLYVANSPYADSTKFSDDIVLQAGVGVRSRLKFDLSALPPLAHINSVMLELTLKEKSLGIGATDSIIVYSSDTIAGLRSGNPYFYIVPKKDSSAIYSISNLKSDLDQFSAEQWVRHPLKNYGLLLQADAGSRELSSVKRYIFYGPAATDHTKRPHLRITYSYSLR